MKIRKYSARRWKRCVESVYRTIDYHCVTRVSRRSTRGIDVKDRSHAAGGGTCSDSLDVRFCNRSQLSDSVKLVAEKNPAKMFARVLST